MESGRVGGETGNCLGWGFSSVVLKYEQIWRRFTFFFHAEVQLAVKPKRGWLHDHAPYCPWPPSGRNEEREKVTEWPYRLLSSPCTCSAVTGFWEQTAISLNQSSALLFLIPLPPPASTQQCPAHCVTKESFRCWLFLLVRSHSKGCDGSLPGSLGRLKDKVGNCKCRWWKWSSFLLRCLQWRLSLKH